VNERAQPSAQLLGGRVPLRALTAELGLASLGRTLQIGIAANAAALATIARSARGPHLAIEIGPARKGVLRAKASAELVGTDPFNVALPSGLDLCVVDLGAARTPEVVEELLYERILPALAQGGIVIASMVRDASEEALDALKVAEGPARKNLQSFLRHQFGGLEIATAGALQRKFDRYGGFEFLGWAPRSKRDAARDPCVWLILRKQRARSDRGRAFARTPRVDRFPKSDFERFLRTLKAEGIALLAARNFARRATMWAQTPRKPAGFGHAKFDIHGNMRRPLEIARIMRDVGYPGLFLMMQRHPINQAFFDAPETWDTLRKMRDMGHEIGLHADVFHFIRVYGDLYTGLEAALAEMDKRGFQVRSLSLHGDSTAHIKSQRLQASDFFMPKFRRSKWSGTPPAGEEFLAEHVGKYSRQKIWSDFGIEFFCEVAFTRRGLRIAKRPLLNVSDNARTLALGQVSKIAKHVAGPAQFRIDAGWTREALPILSRRPFLMLTHPQWYW
jgi:hypothetical protein